jgi:hypothetical protein
MEAYPSPVRKKAKKIEGSETTEEYAALEAKIVKLEAEAKVSRAEKLVSRAEKSKFEAEAKVSRAEKSKFEAEAKVSRAEKLAKSLLSVLPGTDASPIPPLECVGYNTSHSRPKNPAADDSEVVFPVPDLSPVNELLGLELGSTSSCLRTLINSSNNILLYENEFDVHDLVQSALRDATRICNDIFAKSASTSGRSKPTALSVRRESSIFSSIMDHVVVFDVVSNAPVFSVETKKVWAEVKPKVFGQVYDQLSAMQAKGHPNPFGALTCFEKTYITWLENDASQAVLERLGTEGYESARLRRIVVSLPGADDASAPDASAPDEQPCTQSPVKEGVAADDAQFRSKGFVPIVTREVVHSACFKSSEMVAAFVSAILCSLDGYQKPREIKSFQKDQKVEVEALRLDSKSYSWGTFRTTYLGPMEKNKNKKIKEMYLVDHLGTGTTSKVYRALTEDGYDCVVKMYVQRRVDKKLLKEKEFKKKAKSAISREIKAYTTIYGEELKNYVWQQTLNGMCCLIHPYFKHPDENKRGPELREKILARLRQCFKKKKTCFFFAESDQSWRHIGCFKEKLYLFDLGDLLEEKQKGKADVLFKEHIDRLRKCQRPKNLPTSAC